LSKLYALFDFELNRKHKKSIKEFVEVCKRLDADIIQYRDKLSDIDTKIANLIELKQLWDKTLLVNDSVELALFCDGVHLGQEDLKAFSHDSKKAVEIVRSQIGKKMLGLSTHDEKEIEIANILDIDYIGLGAYRGTTTKKDIKGILGSKIENLSKLSTHPTAVIGGVKVDDKIDFAEYRVVGSDLYLYY
jgi:thiamine-phosphate pyrophosphorylase